MSVYNSQNTLEESIQSILSQSFKDFEFLIIDDGSTDESMNIINSFKDNRIRVFKNKKNLGLTKSLNSLILESNGKYIARQDSDDISLPDRLRKQMIILEDSKYQISTSRAWIKGSDDLIPRYNLPYKYLIKFKNPFIHGTLVIDKKLLFEIGLYDESYIYAQDYKLFCDLIKSNKYIYVFKEPLYVLNTINNISSNFKEEQKYFANLARKSFRHK